MTTIRLTTSEALVRYLIAQRTEVDGHDVPLYPGVFAIFGHGNVTSLGHALEQHREEIPVWRGQTEEGMGLAAVAFGKATRRRQVMVATSSIGPGATNMVTAAGVAMANRLPALFISGDAFASRLPDPVLQQVEHFGDPSTTVNDAFRPVVRYWDRLTHPAQLLNSLPQVTRTLLDPADCGPVFLGLPQDVAATAYDYPVSFFEPTLHRVPRPRADRAEILAAAEALRQAERPVLIAGGGVHYSLAEAELAEFAERHGIPVVETVAGKSSLVADHPRYAGPMGVTGAAEPNEACAAADVVVAVGTRLNDFVTGSWTLFDDDARIVALNAARFDAAKHLATPVVGDARESLIELSSLLGDWTAPQSWTDQGSALQARLLDFIASRVADDGEEPLSYAQIIGAVHRRARDEDYLMAAAGGLPGEVNVNWLSRSVASFDCEYGFSCMGYEIAGAWGASFAREGSGGDVITMVGDGSYLMLNSELYSSILSGKKMIVVVCDNGGYAVIERLQKNQGGNSYNNMLRDSTGPGSDVRVDFVAHAAALGAHATRVGSIPELEAAVDTARTHDRSSVIVVDVRESDWTEGGLFWQVGVPEVSELDSVLEANATHRAGMATQRRGV